MSDILYYSDYCKHCHELLTFLKANRLIDSPNISFVSVDRSRVNHQGVRIAYPVDGKPPIEIPHIVTSVPCLLVISNRNLVVGLDQIQSYFAPQINSATAAQGGGNGEPVNYQMGSGGSLGGVAFN